MKQLKKFISGLVLLLLTVISVTGCTKDTSEGKQVTVIHLGVMYSSDIVPLGIIKDQKLDEKYGIELDMQVFSSARYSSDSLEKEIVPRIPDRYEMLQTGNIDLGLMPEPFSTLAKEEGAVLLGSANEEGLYPAVSAFTAEALEQKEEAIDKFYQAYNEAVDYVNGTELAEFEDIVIESAGYPEEIKGKIVLPVYRKNTLPEKDDLEKAIAWAVKKDLCQDGLTPSDLLR